MKKRVLLILSVLLISTLVVFGIKTEAATDTTPPTVTISGITSDTVVKEGGTLTFKIYFDDETELASTYVVENSIITNGFTATKTITGGATKTVTLSNIKGSGSDKYITINSGVAKDTAGNTSKAVSSRAFTITPKPDTTAPTVNISKPSVSSVYPGGTVQYTVYFDDNTAIKAVNFNSNYVTLNGFTASISVTGNGNDERKVTLSNIQGAVGTDKYITVKAGATTDTTGNTSKAVISGKFAITTRPDTTIPTINISKPSVSSIYPGGTVQYTVYFDDNTAIKAVNFDSNYVVPNGFTGTITVSGTGNTRVVTLSNIQGAVGASKYITVKAGAATDTSGNISKAATSEEFAITTKPDTTIPTINISKPNVSSVYPGGTVQYTVYFDDNAAIKAVNFNANYVTLNGFTASIVVTGSGNEERTVTLSNIQGAIGSEKYITVKAGAVTDTSGNTSKAVSSAKFAITTKPDTTVPTVNISKPSASSVYAGGTVQYTVYFDDNTAIKAVNFNANYVTLNGFTASIVVTGSGNEERTVTLSNIQGAIGSEKYITVKAGAVTDTSGNTSKAVSSGKFTIAKRPDTTVPTVNISKPVPESVYVGGTVQYTVYFDDETGIETVNFNSSYVILNGFTASVSVTGSGNEERTVTLSNIQGAIDADNYITVREGAIVDTSGNTSKAVSSAKFAIMQRPDATIPTVTISKPVPSSIYPGQTVSYTVYFDDETGIKTVNFSANYVVLNGFTASVSVTGSGNEERTVILSNIQGQIDADNYITVKAGAVTDTSGNTSKAVSSAKFAIMKRPDETVPTVTISNPSPDKIYAGETVRYTVYFNDDEGIRAINFNSNYVVLNGFTASVSVTGSGNSQRTVTLSNVQGAADSDNYITVKAGAVVDTSGNISAMANSPSFTIKERPDVTAPTIEIDKASPTGIYAGDTVRYTVRFSDDTKLGKIHFNESYVILNGFKADISVSGSGNTRVVTLFNVQGESDSNNCITVKAGAAQDAAGNITKQATSGVFTILEKYKDTIPPIVKISAANPKSIFTGGTIKYNVAFSDNVKVTDINLTSSKIELVGFTADVSVKVDGVKTAIITLKNVKGNPGVNKYIKIASGVALDEPGNRSAKVVSPKFTIAEKASTIVGTKPIITKYTANCIDDLSLLGNINKEITYFASWLRAEKYTATHVQENNYVAEDETMTYMVEYYNGSTAPAPEVKFDLTIPYKVEVEEINGNGKITKRTDSETVITWNVGTVPSYAASQMGYCRLYVRVRFLENEALEKSDKISETFYATLKTTADGNHSYSYMRQLFIDTTEGKTGTYKSYLTNVDTTNEARPDDEITRAEFAKLLADSGILDVKVGSNDYKTFKDHEVIPAYARDAVSALVETNIIQAFPDGEFKPAHPILMEDAMQMVAQAATYISDQKLTVYKPVFLYTEALIGRDKKMSPKKDYIMELMRQNVVVKYESNPDTYALRKHVVAMVNSLTFRGPYVEKLPENTLKFADIRDDSVFFYNIVGASNSYKYTYDYRLWQEIVEIVK